MKTLLTLLVLLFSSSVLADDISDFEIEGMSVGDSLLDYYSLEQIKNMGLFKYKKKFNLLMTRSNKTYDHLQFTVKKNDAKYKIYVLEGVISKNLDECINFKINVVNDVTRLLDDKEKFIDIGKNIHSYDKSGKSIAYSHLYKFASGAQIKVQCQDWSDQITNQEGWEDNFRIIFNTSEFVEFNKNAF